MSNGYGIVFKTYIDMYFPVVHGIILVFLKDGGVYALLKETVPKPSDDRSHVR